ncbi:MAG: SDR family oxidoreductase [Alphaproteobacteria bacterium]|nr:SDR family oxidoreductase [Alphaproteobacteria bacterium]
MTALSLAGKVALITGAASGIGRAAARRFASAGARLALADLADCAPLADELAAQGCEAQALALDVTSEAAWQSAVAAVLARFGRLDILINNAGISGPNIAIDNMTLEGWRKVTSVNLDGAFLGMKHCIPAIRAAGGGAVVNTSSIAGLIGMAGGSAYGAAKAGLALLTKVSALEEQALGSHVRVNSVHPGFIDTAMLRRIVDHPNRGPAAREVIRAMQPGAATGQPEDIAEGMLYLSSDAARFVTGAELVIDAGVTAQ